jgi:acetolactate synthase I/II/III large subunit
MAKISGGAVLVRSLLSHGAECVFTLCGNHLLSTYDAAIGTRLRLVDVRQESAAAHMADAWTRVTGRPGVCLVTGGPGHTNALTGVATAWAADSPIIFLSGSSERALRGKGAMQELDQVGLARPIVKWAAEVEDPRQIPAMIARAYRVAQTGRPGPVHLTLPVDVLDATADDLDVAQPVQANGKQFGRTAPNPASIDRALAALAQSERPVIIAGAGAWWSDAGEQLREFVETAGVPLFTIDTARGIVSDDHPLCFGYADPLLNPAASLLGEADLVILLGKRLDFRLRFGEVFAPEAAIVQIDAEALDVGQNRTVEVPVVGDVAIALEELLLLVQGKPLSFEPWVRRLGRAAAEGVLARVPAEGSDETPLHPLRVVREVRDLLGDDYCLAFDAGDFVQWARQALPARVPGGWLRLGPMATLGAAIPFALAAKLARPSARVFALTGDGGVGFYGYELDTAVRHAVPFVTVVANDAAWGMEKNLQLGIYGPGRVIGSELRPTRYDEVMRALGGHGEHVTRPEELRPALERALTADGPSLVNVETAGIPSTLTDAAVRRKLARR